MQPQSNLSPIAVAAGAAAAVAAEPLFDLELIEDVTEAEVQLKRNGQPLPVFVTLAGPEHHKRKAYAFNKQRRVRKALMEGGQAFSDPAEEVLEENDLLVNCVLGWRGVAFGGQPLECTPVNVRQLLEDPKRQWFRKALLEAFNSTEAFTKVSAIV